MSFSGISWAGQQTCRSGIAKSVLLCIADAADKTTGECERSVAYIVRWTQHTEGAVRRALKALAEDRQIERVRQTAARMDTVCRYRIPTTGYLLTEATQETGGRYQENGVAETADRYPENMVARASISEDRYNELEVARNQPKTQETPGLPTQNSTGPATSNSTSLPILTVQESKESVPEKETISSSAQKLSVPPPPSKRERPGLIPDNWQPTDRGVEFATAHNVDLETQVPRFVAYHQARGNRYVWDAAWRTWCMNNPKYQPPPKKPYRLEDDPLCGMARL